MARAKKTYKGYNEVFPDNLRNIMYEKDITQQDLATKCGVSRQSVSYWQNGDSVPDAMQLKKIAEYLEVSSDYLLGLAQEPTADKDLNFVCEYTGLHKKSIERLTTCRPEFTNTLNSLLENNNFWLLLDRISQYRNLSSSVLPIEKWLNEGVYVKSGSIIDGAPTDLINKRDLALFQIQETIKDIAKDGVDNG